MLKIGEIVVPDFGVAIENAEEVIRAMAAWELAALKTRIRSGRDRNGAALPRSKAGNAPMTVTGQLVDSIKIQMREYRGQPYALLLPTGDRYDAIRRSVSRTTRARTLRSTLRKQGLSSKEIQARVRQRFGGRTRNLRNMDIAAILAHKAKDKRARGRGVYDPWGITPDEREALGQLAAHLLRVALEERGSGARYSGRGDYR